MVAATPAPRIAIMMLDRHDGSLRRRAGSSRPPAPNFNQLKGLQRSEDRQIG